MEELVTKDSIIRYKVTVDGAEYSIEDTVPKKCVSFKIQSWIQVTNATVRRIYVTTIPNLAKAYSLGVK